jgi:hypothetical protein
LLAVKVHKKVIYEIYTREQKRQYAINDSLEGVGAALVLLPAQVR